MNMTFRESASKPPLYIFDVDGTLANIKHRLPILQDESLNTNTKWRMFFDQCDKDLPVEANFRTLHYLLYIGCDVWFWTGRSDEVEQKTCEWLQTYCTFFEACRDADTMKLRMRPASNYTPDHELKQQWLHEMNKEDRARLVAVFEDRSEVVAMFRRNGVTCFQVDDGDIEAFKEQTEEEVIEETWGKAFRSGVCPGTPIMWVAKTPYSTVGKPATTDFQRRMVTRMVENNDEWPTVTHPNQVRFIMPKIAEAVA